MKVFAVQPPRGNVVHLHVPGYQPGPRARSGRDSQAMCGAGIWPNGNPRREHTLAPLKEAVRWTTLLADPTDPRPPWRWCRPCLGHLVTECCLEQYVLSAVARRGEQHVGADH